MTTVLLADDHSIIREGFRTYIKKIIPHAIIEEAFDGDSAFEKIKHTNFSIIILDINMPDTDSISLVKNIMAVKPQSRILIFSMNPEELYAKQLFNLGVLGYLNKAAFADEIKQAIENVINNKMYLSPSFTQRLRESAVDTSITSGNPFDLLSGKELEITKHLLDGESVSEIASLLHLDALAVANQKEKILRKLHCKNIVKLNELASQYNFVQRYYS